MPISSLAEASAICRRNANGKSGKPAPDQPLRWNRETMHTIVSECRTYRISKMEDPHNKGVFGYELSLPATPTSPPIHLAGPYLIPKDARDAAEAHRRGEPLQADLA